MYNQQAGAVSGKLPRKRASPRKRDEKTLKMTSIFKGVDMFKFKIVVARLLMLLFEKKKTKQNESSMSAIFNVYLNVSSERKLHFVVLKLILFMHFCII